MLLAAVPLMVLARRWRVCPVALLRLAVMAFTAAVVGVISIGSVVVVLRRCLLIWPVWVRRLYRYSQVL